VAAELQAALLDSHPLQNFKHTRLLFRTRRASAHFFLAELWLQHCRLVCDTPPSKLTRLLFHICRAASHFSNLAALWLEHCRLVCDTLPSKLTRLLFRTCRAASHFSNLAALWLQHVIVQALLFAGAECLSSPTAFLLCLQSCLPLEKFSNRAALWLEHCRLVCDTPASKLTLLMFCTCRAASHFSNLAALWLEQCRLPFLYHTPLIAAETDTSVVSYLQGCLPFLQPCSSLAGGLQAAPQLAGGSTAG
jgi:predicted outer membrane lipoprotein